MYWRFTLLQILLLTTFVALGCFALRSASPTIVSVTFAIVMVSLTAGVLFACFRAHHRRAFWIGFTICGSLYLLVLVCGWTIFDNFDTDENPLAIEALLTSKVTTSIYDSLYDPVLHGSGSSLGGRSFGYVQRYPAEESAPEFVNFLNTAHGLWTLLLATSGGWLARWIYATGPAAKKKPSEVAAA